MLGLIHHGYNISYTGSGPISATAKKVGYSVVVDPDLLGDGVDSIKVVFGGVLKGNTGVTFSVWKGGAWVGENQSPDGDEVFTAAPLTSPLNPFVIDCGLIPVGPGPTLLTVAAAHDGPEAFSIDDFFFNYAKPEVPGPPKDEPCLVQYQIVSEIEAEDSVERVLRQWSHDLRAVESDQAIVTLTALVKAAADTAGTFRVRVGGTPDFVDGVPVAELTTTSTSYENRKAQGALINPRALVLVKLTGQVAAGSGRAAIRGATITALKGG